MLTEEEAKIYRKMIFDAIEGFSQPGPILISEVFFGPRHNEFGFRCSNGKEIYLAVRDHP